MAGDQWSPAFFCATPGYVEPVEKNGLGVEKNYAQALKHYQDARQYGDKGKYLSYADLIKMNSGKSIDVLNCTQN